jgi:hypothetical protein
MRKSFTNDSTLRRRKLQKSGSEGDWLTSLQGAPTVKGIRVAPDTSASGFSHRTATGVPRQTAASRNQQRREWRVVALAPAGIRP